MKPKKLKLIQAYHAGPDVFRDHAFDFLLERVNNAKQFGIDLIIPIETESNSKTLTAKSIFDNNVEKIKSCDIVIANLSPFRGPSADPGTVWEIAYAKALGKKVYGFSTHPKDYLTKVKQLKIEDPEYPLIEDFGLKDNLMIFYGVDFWFDSFHEVLQQFSID